jgi:hypothetical protein
MRSLGLLLVVALLGSSGCYLFHEAPGSSELPSTREGCRVQSYRAARVFDPVDMVWVVDSSRSMLDEQARIRQTINTFVSDVEGRHFDVRLVMITATNIVPPPLGSDGSRYLFVQRAVSSREPLQALLDTLPQYRSFLRPSAALHFVVVTDDDSAITAQAFETAMLAGIGHPFVVHAIASPDVDGMPCQKPSDADGCTTALGRSRGRCGAAAIGKQYYALAEQSGGEEISICVDDFAQVFGPLLEAVGRTEIPCIIDLSAADSSDTQVTLSRPGATAATLTEVESAARCGDSQGFYYTPNTLLPRIELCPAACGGTTNVDAELRVSVDCSEPK